MTSSLFQPIQLRGLALENRIMVSPMCQYSAVDGCMTDWHFAHLGMLSNSGAALIQFYSSMTLMEWTVSAEGKCWMFCLN